MINKKIRLGIFNYGKYIKSLIALIAIAGFLSSNSGVAYSDSYSAESKNSDYMPRACSAWQTPDKAVEVNETTSNPINAFVQSLPQDVDEARKKLAGIEEATPEELKEAYDLYYGQWLPQYQAERATQRLNDAADANGTARVSDLRSADGFNFTPGWWPAEEAIGHDEHSETTFPLNPNYYADQETTQRLAQELGGVVTTIPGPVEGPFSWPDQPAIRLPDGRVLNAGLVARKLQQLQSTYRRAVDNYELNLTNNIAIIGTGYLTEPVDPFEALRNHYLNN